MNDILRTDFFLRYTPQNFACAWIYLSARDLKISYDLDDKGKLDNLCLHSVRKAKLEISVALLLTIEIALQVMDNGVTSHVNEDETLLQDCLILKKLN